MTLSRVALSSIALVVFELASRLVIIYIAIIFSFITQSFLDCC